MSKTVIGIFDNVVEARQAVQRLYNAGLLQEQIDMTDTTSSTSGSETDTHKEGGVSGFFKGLFSSVEDSDKYVRVARYSESVVTVRTRSAAEAEQAARILDSCGAVNVDERAASYAESAPEQEAFLTRTSSQPPVEPMVTESIHLVAEPAGKISRIPVLEAHLRQNQPEVLTGGTRIRSRILERPIETLAGDRGANMRENWLQDSRTASTGQTANFTAQDIELTETKEVNVISKEARVVEELRVGKAVEVSTETLKGTVRKTEIDVENVNAGVPANRQGQDGSTRV
jgi:hypothetical protein